MVAVTESDLKELKDLIQAQTAQLTVMQQNITDLQKNVTDLQKDVVDLKFSNERIEATLQSQQLLIQKIPDLAEKVGELKNWRTRCRRFPPTFQPSVKQIGLVFVSAVVSSIFSGTIGGIIGWLIRGPKV